MVSNSWPVEVIGREGTTGKNREKNKILSITYATTKERKMILGLNDYIFCHSLQKKKPF